MTTDYKIEDINVFLDTNDYTGLKRYMNEHNLELKNNKIVPVHAEYYSQQHVFYDQRQLIRKILLNSLYGAIGNPGSRWYDPRIAQSTTLCGRCIVKHMSGKINEIIAGDYNHVGKAIIYGDTDSVDASSIINTSIGNKTIEELFLNGTTFWNEGDKEYSRNDIIQLLEYKNDDKTVKYQNYNYVYRHKVSKKKYKITTTNGKSVIVTEDHSVMVLDLDGNLISKKPRELLKNDNIISL